MKKRWKNKKFRPKVTKAEMRFFFTGLKNAGILFQTQKIVQGASGKHYRVDGLVAPNIIVEIDGESHNDSKQKVKDLERDRDLCKAGFTVIRFRNWEVYKQLGKCVEAVRNLCLFSHPKLAR